MRHGKGVWRKNTEDSDVYDGGWISGKKCHEGVYTWASGNVYRGNFFDDLRDGYGEMYWTDGKCYKGNWRRGVQDGVGVLYVPGKQRLNGLFKDDVYCGPAEEEEKRTVFPPISPLNTTDRQRIRSSNGRRYDNAKTKKYTEENHSLETDLSHSQFVEYASIEGQPLPKNNIKHLRTIDSQPSNLNDTTELKRKLLKRILQDIDEFPLRNFRVLKRDQSIQVSTQPEQVLSKSLSTTPWRNRPRQERSGNLSSSPMRNYPITVKPLDPAELLRWNAKLEKMPIKEQKKYKNLNDPYVVKEIRDIMYPKRWRLWRRHSILQGKSDIELPPIPNNIRSFFRKIA